MDNFPVFVDLLAPYRDAGLAHALHSPLCGTLPSHRCTVFQLSLAHDPLISSEHLLMRTSLRDRLSGEIVASRTDICKALSLGSFFDSDSNREFYVREMCQMIAPVVRAHKLKLRHLSRVIDAMNESWNILGVFQELEELDAVFRRRRSMAQDMKTQASMDVSGSILKFVDGSLVSPRGKPTASLQSKPTQVEDPSRQMIFSVVLMKLVR